MPTTLEEEKTELASPLRRYTFEEFLAWPGEHRKIEWVDGEIIEMAAVSRSHAELTKFLLFILTAWIRKNKLGWVMGPEFAMKLDAARRGREPDLMFVTAERMDLIRDNYLDGASDVAVEIISPESIGRDRGEKFVEYEAAGVREYWLIDPIRQQAEFYRLGDDGHYRLVSTETDGIFRSQVIAGFWLRVEWLWNLPDEFEVLQELGIGQITE